MFRTGSLMTLLALSLFISPALGSDPIVPVSQDRWVFVYAYAHDFTGTDEDSVTLAASDFGSFLADTTVTATMSYAIASGASSQTSQIGIDSVQATGGISAQGESFDYDAWTSADGESHFEVTFEVTSPADFALGGVIGASGPACSTTVSLDGPSGSIAAFLAKNQTTPILETGTLEPGTHTLIADTGGRGFGDFFSFFQASGSYDVLLTVTPSTDVTVGGPDDGSFVVAPNPFREQTTISLGIPGTMAVDASIFDLQGRLVRELSGFEGDPKLSWDGRDRRGELVHPGVYFVRLEAGDEVHHLKVTRIR